LADQAVSLGKDTVWVHYFQLVKGLAEYRAEYFSSAVEWVGKSIDQSRNVGGSLPDWNRDGAAYSLLAMAQHQLKRPDEARAAFAKALEIVNTKMQKLENGTLDDDWVDWLVAHILLREAQAVIQGLPRTPEDK
jgi:tetratricopeptide (TPR) repeat protein